MSSPVILSISTVFALVGIVMAAIAFSTDDWEMYDVEREAIKARVRCYLRRCSFTPHSLQMRVNSTFETEMTRLNFNSDPMWFDRSYGLLHVCFPQELPQGES